ncbi:MAG: hypothetical protein MK538_09575, partial [Planctomycetes bacterium]|nr:hypothetical protein [Planctomycetota bacterium]
LERAATYEARIKPPQGWNASPEFASIELQAGARGELSFTAVAPQSADRTRRLLTAELKIDGEPQGEISEALVTTRAPVNPGG